MRLVVFGALTASALVSSCAQSLHASDEDPILQLERDLGPDGVMDLLATHSPREIAAVLDAYEIGYVDAPAGLALITDCPQYFPASDRTAWHQIGGEYYYIDAYGRPSRAYTDLPPIVTEARMSSCQTRIGQWGDAENASNDYDGGHLIGSQLGGWGGRANLVPQDSNFNRGSWAVLENAMADCGGLPARELRYYITVAYPNTTRLVPSTFGMRLTNNDTGDNITLSFSNTDGGGTTGVSERDRGVAFLADQGCD